MIAPKAPIPGTAAVTIADIVSGAALSAPQVRNYVPINVSGGERPEKKTGITKEPQGCPPIIEKKQAA